MLEKERAAIIEKLNRLCAATAGSAIPAATLMDELANGCADAVKVIEALGFALDEATEDLQHMGGCPSCKHNCAPNRHTDIAICERKLPFPHTGCYVWRGKAVQQG